MRKAFVATSCLLLVCCAGWVFGQQNAWNGTRWKTLSPFERAVFVMGFNRGHAAGMRDGMKAVLDVLLAARPATSWTPKERQALEEKADQLDQKSAGKQDVTIQQLESAVSSFYEDHKNTNVCWDDAVLLSTASLQGNAPTEQELAAARKSGAESGCE